MCRVAARTGLGILLALAACLLESDPAAACDFIVLRAPQGRHVSDMRSDAEPYLDFLARHAAPPNNDGYGLAMYHDGPLLADSQRVYATGLGTVWYGNNDLGALDSAVAALWRPENPARILLGHARNGTGGLGSHPFVQHRSGRSYAFQHNGDLTDGTSRDMKEALLAGLDQCGYFGSALDGGSNWLGEPGDVDSWIDSELLFFYLLQRIDEAGGDVLLGLHEALGDEDWHGFNVRADITSADSLRNPASVINFALCDGDWTYVFRNSRAGDPAYELSWGLAADGLAAVRTREAPDLTPLKPYELLVVPPVGTPWTTPLLDGGPPPSQPEALSLLSAFPNPFNPGTTLRFQLPWTMDCALTIHNLHGQRVATLLDGSLPAGFHDLRWEGRTDMGGEAAAGAYLALLRQGNTRTVRKLLLLR